MYAIFIEKFRWLYFYVKICQLYFQYYNILLHFSFFSYTPSMLKIISHTPKKENNSSYNPENIQITLTCQSWLESLVRREGEKLGLTDIQGQDRLISGKWTLETLYRLLIGSRFANRVYMEISLAENGESGKITDFDTLHDTLADIVWSDYISGKEGIVIEAASTRSQLSNTPTIQAVGQKAIFSTLNTPNLTNGTEVHILILIIDDIAHILLDVTGDPLHKRGYRKEAGEAPIKENLAAALVAFSGWRYKESLLDPFCGSGTIAIEAALMARNIAPGIGRRFRIESLPFHDAGEFMKVKNTAQTKSYPSGEYKIQASDMNAEMIEIARGNALRAGVAWDINFEVGNFLSLRHCEERSNPSSWDSGSPHSATASFAMTGAIVTNPPYGKRLESDDLDDIYKKLIHEVSENGGGFITTYPVDVRFGLANRKLLNGSEECRFYYKKK